MNSRHRKSDRKERPKTEDEKLDDALKGTFPASDPPAMTIPHRPRGKEHERRSH